MEKTIRVTDVMAADVATLRGNKKLTFLISDSMPRVGYREEAGSR